MKNFSHDFFSLKEDSEKLCRFVPNNNFKKTLTFDFLIFSEDPHLILQGHRSIVNQIRYDQHHSLLASSGVEKCIKVIFE